MTDLTDLPATLTVTETAEQLRISKRSVFKLLESGELDSIKIGRSRRILRTSLAAYLDALAAGNAS